MNTAIRYIGFLFLAVVVCGGCGAQMVPVSGTVQRDGQIVPGGSVLFRPVSSESKPAVGPIQADGKFEMMTENPGDGVMIGKYRVVIAGERGSSDERTRTTYMGPSDKPVEVVAGKPNELVINISEDEGWEAVRAVRDDDE
jgi:hypothetical protein